MRAAARRTAARVIVWPPVYPVAARLPRTALLAARAAFRTGRDDRLEATLDRLERRHPAAQVLRADLRSFQGRYEEALRAAERAAAAQPASAAAAARLVSLGYRVRERAAAEQAAVAAVRRFPRSPEVLWQVAMACDSAAQYERIAAAWQARSDPAPADLLRVLRQLAVAAARAGQLDAAMARYRAAIELLLDGATPPPTRRTRLAGLAAGEAIGDLCRALDGAGIPFFFAAGTALGLVREGRPLGADADIDIGVFASDWDREALVALFTRDPRFDLDLHPQTQRVGLRHRGGSPVDIFRFYEQDGRVWHDGVFVRWHNSPFRVVRQRIGRQHVPLPADPGRYLTENYGDGWRIPWPGFDAFTDDAPNLEVTWPEYQRVHLVRRGYERLAAGDRAAAGRELRRCGEPELADRL
jgi:hypothetical protein